MYPPLDTLKPVAGNLWIVDSGPLGKAGPYCEALDLLAIGLFTRNGIARIALACFPDGHSRISRTALDHALDAKLRLAARDGLEVLLVSQFVVDAHPLLDYAQSLRSRGETAPLRVGLARPADIDTPANSTPARRWGYWSRLP